MLVVRKDLIGPDRLTRVRTPGKNRTSPLVITWAHIGVPRTGVGRAVVHEFELRIVRDPAPGRPPSDLPGISGPCFHAQIPTALGSIEGFKVVSNQYVLIGACRVRAPDDLPIASI